MILIHPTSIIDKNATIGEGSNIWHWTHISEGAIIGKNCSIGQNVYIGKNVKIGDDVKIQNNVSIFEGVEIHNNVFCGPSVVFTNVVNPRAHVSRKNEYKKTIVEEGVTLGANTTIICGINISTFAFIGAGSLVTKNVKSFSLMIGLPAKQIGWMSRYGKKLKLPIAGKGEEICQKSRKKYILNINELSEHNI